jgi:hypothetical protein
MQDERGHVKGLSKDKRGNEETRKRRNDEGARETKKRKKEETRKRRNEETKRELAKRKNEKRKKRRNEETMKPRNNDRCKMK